MTFQANAPQRRMWPCVDQFPIKCPKSSSFLSVPLRTLFRGILHGRPQHCWPKCGSVGARWLIKACSNTQNCVLFFSKEVHTTIGYLNTSRSHRFERRCSGRQKSCRDLASNKGIFLGAVCHLAHSMCPAGELWNRRSLRTWAHFRCSREDLFESVEN